MHHIGASLRSNSFSLVTRHRSAKHRNVCHSTKYMMLHIRDCSGLLSNGDVCPFPWCKKTKHLLYHLVSCKDGKKCSICCPANLSSNLTDLVGLNAHRRKIFVDKVEKAKAAMQSKQPQPQPTPSSQLPLQTAHLNRTLPVKPSATSTAQTTAIPTPPNTTRL